MRRPPPSGRQATRAVAVTAHDWSGVAPPHPPPRRLLAVETTLAGRCLAVWLASPAPAILTAGVDGNCPSRTPYGADPGCSGDAAYHQGDVVPRSRACLARPGRHPVGPWRGTWKASCAECGAIEFACSNRPSSLRTSSMRPGGMLAGPADSSHHSRLGADLVGSLACNWLGPPRRLGLIILTGSARSGSALGDDGLDPRAPLRHCPPSCVSHCRPVAYEQLLINGHPSLDLGARSREP